jgi:hypothetical protein
MKQFVQLFILAVLMLSLNSCFVNRTTIGYGPEGKDRQAVKFSKTKQMYVLWGLMALKKKHVELPVECGYQIRTSFNVVDAIVSVLTAGIFSMRTEKILVLRDSQCDPAIRKLENKLQRKEMQEEKHP